MSERSEPTAERHFLLDAMVLASGLTSMREPPSNSRRLVDMAIAGAVRLVLTDRVLDETRAVIVNPRYRDRVTGETADRLLGVLAGAAEVVIHDAGVIAPHVTLDHADDYLAAAALKSGAYLVTRDQRAHLERVPGFGFGPPGAALRMLRGPGGSLLGAVRESVTRWPLTDDWMTIKERAWKTPDPDWSVWGASAALGDNGRLGWEQKAQRATDWAR